MEHTSHRDFPSQPAKLIIFVALVAFFVPLSFERLVAKDEGFYVIASKLIAHGALPYIDFFYPQMPLLPFVYGLAVKLFGESWLILRAVSGVFTAGLGTLLFIVVYRESKFFGGVLALVVFALCNFVHPWQLTVQTYILSTLLLFASYCALEWRKLTSPPVLSGILFGLSISTRLFFAGLYPVYVFVLLRTCKSWQQGRQLVVWFTLGTMLGMFPCYYFLALDFDLFYFNNLGYHLHRTALSPEQIWQNKERVLQVILGFHDSVKFDAPHLPILLWVSLLGSLILKLRGTKVHSSLYFALGLLVLNFLPAPSYVQYFCTLIPFLICTSLYVGNGFFDLTKKKLALSTAIFVTGSIVLAGLYLNNSIVDLKRYTRTGEGVIGIRSPENAAHWNLDRISQVSALVNRNVPTGQKVVTIWPGYLLETNTTPLPGLENHFGSRIAPRISTQERAKYHVMTLKEVSQLIMSNRESYVLEDKRATKRNISAAIKNRGCKLLEKEDLYFVYRCEAKS